MHVDRHSRHSRHRRHRRLAASFRPRSALGLAGIIAGKDLKQRMRDRSALVVAFILPLALTVIFAQSLSDIDSAGPGIRLALTDGDSDGNGKGADDADNAADDADNNDAAPNNDNDNDNDDIAQRGLRAALQQLEQSGVIVLSRASSRAQAVAWVADGTADTAIVLPPRWAQAVTSATPVQIEILAHGQRPIAAAVAETIAQQFAQQVRAVQVAVATALVHLPLGQAEPRALATQAAAMPAAIVFEDLTASQKELDPKTRFAAGMAVFFLFFTVQFAVTGLLEERRLGTMQRLLAAPMPPSAILIGKLATGVVMGVGSVGALALASALILGANWGDGVGALVLIVTAVLAAVAITGLVASFAATAEQANNAQAVVAIVLGTLGGSFFPVAQGGETIAMLSMLTPHAWFLQGLATLQSGGGIIELWPALLALGAMTIAASTIALVRLAKAVAL